MEERDVVVEVSPQPRDPRVITAGSRSRRGRGGAGAGGPFGEEGRTRGVVIVDGVIVAHLVVMSVRATVVVVIVVV